MKIEKWIEKNISIKKFTNKTVMITGGNSGIGFELAKHPVKLEAKGFIEISGFRELLGN